MTPHDRGKAIDSLGESKAFAAVNPRYAARTSHQCEIQRGGECGRATIYEDHSLFSRARSATVTPRTSRRRGKKLLLSRFEANSPDARINSQCKPKAIRSVASPRRAPPPRQRYRFRSRIAKPLPAWIPARRRIRAGSANFKGERVQSRGDLPHFAGCCYAFESFDGLLFESSGLWLGVYLRCVIEERADECSSRCRFAPRGNSNGARWWKQGVPGASNQVVSRFTFAFRGRSSRLTTVNMSPTAANCVPEIPPSEPPPPRVMPATGFVFPAGDIIILASSPVPPFRARVFLSVDETELERRRGDVAVRALPTNFPATNGKIVTLFNAGPSVCFWFTRVVNPFAPSSAAYTGCSRYCCPRVSRASNWRSREMGKVCRYFLLFWKLLFLVDEG